MIISPVNPQYSYNRVQYSPAMDGYKRIRKTLPSSQTSSNKFINALREYFLGYPKRINYTWQHKKAFLKVEKELCGKNTLGGYLHDTDKLFMYAIGIPHNIAHKIHVATAPHHIRNGTIKRPMMAIIDWECARYTKPDKPLNARTFYEKKCPKIPVIEMLLDKYGL